MKFNPIFRVTIYNPDNTIVIGSQDEARLGCKFNVTRGLLSDANKCSIQLYNLAPSTREKIFADMYQPFDINQWKYVKLEAGYDGKLSEIFNGRILQAYSIKSGGQVDFITEIQAQALDMFGCQSSHTFEAGTTYKEAIQTIVNDDMPNVSIANVGELDGAFLTNTTVEGNALENINQIAGGNAFVDGNNLNVLLSNEVIDVPVPVIKDDTGLLETPNRHDAFLEVKMLFEPSLIVGQLLEIKSETAPIFNGQYKVLGFTHNCTISGSEAGNRTTTVSLYYGTRLIGAGLDLSGSGGVRSNGFNKVSGFTVTPVTEEMKSQALQAYKYIQMNKGKIPPWMITNNITWTDMIGHSNNNNDRYTTLSYSHCINIVATCTKFQEIITKYFPSGVTINSGWRSPRANAQCGGVPNSYHMQGKAIDFTRGVASVSKDFSLMNRVWKVGYLQKYPSFIHCDTRGFKGYANDK
jgi:hypothetical protein